MANVVEGPQEARDSFLLRFNGSIQLTSLAPPQSAASDGDGQSFSDEAVQLLGTQTIQALDARGGSSRGLAVSDKYGVTVAILPTGKHLLVAHTALLAASASRTLPDVAYKLHEDGGDDSAMTGHPAGKGFKILRLDVADRATVLTIAANELTLCVAAGSQISTYELNSLLAQQQYSVARAVVQHSFTSAIVTVKWNPNPALVSRLLVCLADGKVELMEVTSAECKRQSASPATVAPVRAIDWSRKGKQFVCACRDGSLTTFEEGFVKKQHYPAPVIAEQAPQAIGVEWLANYTFGISYQLSNLAGTPADADLPNPVVSILDGTKESQTFYNFESALYKDFGSRRADFLHGVCESSWPVFIYAYNDSTELAVFGKSVDGTTWQHWQLPENGGGNVPLFLSADGDVSEVSMVTGLALDLTSQNPVTYTSPRTGEPVDGPPAPRLLLLTAHGTLSFFTLLDQTVELPKKHPNVLQSVEPLPKASTLSSSKLSAASATSMQPLGAGLNPLSGAAAAPVATAAPATTTAPPPLTSGFGAAFGSKPFTFNTPKTATTDTAKAFSAPAFGASAVPAFGSPATPMFSLSKPADASKPASGFGVPPVSTPSFTSTATTATTATTTTTTTTAAAATAAPSKPATLSFGGTSAFGAAASTTTPASNPASAAKPAAVATFGPSTTAGSTPAFGSSTFGSLPTAAAITTPTAAKPAIPTPSTAAATAAASPASVKPPVIAFGAGLGASSPIPATAAVKPVDFGKAPIPTASPASLTAVPPKPAFGAPLGTATMSGTPIPTPAVTATPASTVDTPARTILPTVPAAAATTDVTATPAKVTTAAAPAPEVSKTVLLEQIHAVMTTFEKDLQYFRSQVAVVPEFSVNTTTLRLSREEVLTATSISNTKALLRQETQNAGKLLKQVFDASSSTEYGLLLAAERNNSDYMVMSRNRPLDPESAELRKSIREKLEASYRLEQNIKEELDSRWEVRESRRQASSSAVIKRSVRIPTATSIYETIHNNMKTARRFRIQVDNLAGSMKRLGFEGFSATDNANMSTRVVHAAAGTTLRPLTSVAPATPTVLSPARLESLGNLIASRESVRHSSPRLRGRTLPAASKDSSLLLNDSFAQPKRQLSFSSSTPAAPAREAFPTALSTPMSTSVATTSAPAPAPVAAPVPAITSAAAPAPAPLASTSFKLPAFGVPVTPLTSTEPKATSPVTKTASLPPFSMKPAASSISVTEEAPVEPVKVSRSLSSLKSTSPSISHSQMPLPNLSAPPAPPTTGAATAPATTKPAFSFSSSVTAKPATTFSGLPTTAATTTPMFSLPSATAKAEDKKPTINKNEINDEDLNKIEGLNDDDDFVEGDEDYYEEEEEYDDDGNLIVYEPHDDEEEEEEEEEEDDHDHDDVEETPQPETGSKLKLSFPSAPTNRKLFDEDDEAVPVTPVKPTATTVTVAPKFSGFTLPTVPTAVTTTAPPKAGIFSNAAATSASASTSTPTSAPSAATPPAPSGIFGNAAAKANAPTFGKPGFSLTSGFGSSATSVSTTLASTPTPQVSAPASAPAPAPVSTSSSEVGSLSFGSLSSALASEPAKTSESATLPPTAAATPAPAPAPAPATFTGFGAGKATMAFGSAAPPAATNAFGTKAVAGFGAPVGALSASPSTPFGSSSASTGGGFGSSSTSTSTSVFGKPAGATVTPSSGFGGLTLGGSSSSAAPATGSVFGTPAAPSTMNAFATPSTTSGFGSPAAASSTNVFGKPATSGFGVAPGNSSTTTSGFGGLSMGSSSAASGTGGVFGGANKGVFGGAAANAATSGSTSGSTFGTVSGFGAPPATSSFGGSAFGSSPQQPGRSTFGSSAAPAQSTGGFGSPAFGSSPAFSAPRPAMATSGFGSSAPKFGSVATGGATFGGSPSFGSLAQSSPPSFGGAAAGGGGFGQGGGGGFGQIASGGGFGQNQGGGFGGFGAAAGGGGGGGFAAVAANAGGGFGNGFGGAGGGPGFGSGFPSQSPEFTQHR